MTKLSIAFSFKYKVLVSEGSTVNVSTAQQFETKSPPFIFNNVKEGVIYSFAVVVVTDDGYSSKLSEINSYQIPPGEHFKLQCTFLQGAETYFFNMYCFRFAQRYCSFNDEPRQYISSYIVTVVSLGGCAGFLCVPAQETAEEFQ